MRTRRAEIQGIRPAHSTKAHPMRVTHKRDEVDINRTIQVLNARCKSITTTVQGYLKMRHLAVSHLSSSSWFNYMVLLWTMHGQRIGDQITYRLLLIGHHNRMTNRYVNIPCKDVSYGGRESHHPMHFHRQDVTETGHIIDIQLKISSAKLMRSKAQIKKY